MVCLHRSVAAPAGSFPIPDTREKKHGAKSYFQQTVFLRDWWLIKAKNCLEGKRLAVCLGGFTSGESLVAYQALRVFNSAPIAKRFDDTTLETVDGVIILIRGFINRDRTVENGFSSKIFDYFSSGFPLRWKSCASKCMISMDTSGINLQNTSNLKRDVDQGKLNSILETTPSKLKGLEDETHNGDESDDCDFKLICVSHAHEKSNLSTIPPLFHSQKAEGHISTIQEPSGSPATLSSETRMTKSPSGSPAKVSSETIMAKSPSGSPAMVSSETIMANSPSWSPAMLFSETRMTKSSSGFPAMASLETITAKSPSGSPAMLFSETRMTKSSSGFPAMGSSETITAKSLSGSPAMVASETITTKSPSGYPAMVSSETITANSPSWSPAMLISETRMTKSPPGSPAMVSSETIMTKSLPGSPAMVSSETIMTRSPPGSPAMVSSQTRMTKSSVASEGNLLSSFWKTRSSDNSKQNDGNLHALRSATTSSCSLGSVNLRDALAMLSAGKKLRSCPSIEKVAAEKDNSSEERKMKTHVLSPESLSFKRSRSGRMLKPALHFWRNQIPLYDADRNFTGIQQELLPADDRNSTVRNSIKPPG